MHNGEQCHGSQPPSRSDNGPELGKTLGMELSSLRDKLLPSAGNVMKCLLTNHPVKDYFGLTVTTQPRLSDERTLSTSSFLLASGSGSFA